MGRWNMNRMGKTCGLLVLLMASAAVADGPLTKAPANATQRGRTFVAVNSSIEGLVRGRAPDSLDQLRALEQQVVQVVERARECTVSVRIGNAQGAGVIVSPDGYVLTAAHVAMRPGLSAILIMSDGRRLRAKTLGMNRNVDAGLIKIESPPEDLPCASLGTSRDLRPGMWCVAVGHPGGYEQGRGPVIRAGRILSTRDQAIVTDCALISGDSGGPLFDVTGRLIAIHSRIGNDILDNIHVPIDYYDTSWDRMAAGQTWGHLPGFKPVIGVTRNPDSEVAQIGAVKPESPAEKAGLQAGDVVLGFNNVTITDFPSLIAAVEDTMPGEHVMMRVQREESVFNTTVVIGRSNDD